MGIVDRAAVIAASSELWITPTTASSMTGRRSTNSRTATGPTAPTRDSSPTHAPTEYGQREDMGNQPLVVMRVDLTQDPDDKLNLVRRSPHGAG